MTQLDRVTIETVYRKFSGTAAPALDNPGSTTSATTGHLSQAAIDGITAAVVILFGASLIVVCLILYKYRGCYPVWEKVDQEEYGVLTRHRSGNDERQGYRSFPGESGWGRSRTIPA
jgi:hypothetical protein